MPSYPSFPHYERDTPKLILITLCMEVTKIQKTGIDGQLREHGIANTNIVHEGSSGTVNLVEPWGMSVIYGNQPFMKSFTNLDAGEICLLRHAVDDHFGLALDKMRNRDVGREKFSKRLRFGVGQNQHTSRKIY